MGNQQTTVAARMSKRKTVEALTKLKEAFTHKKDQPFVDAIDVALADLAKCPACLGAGTQTSSINHAGWKPKQTPRGTYFVGDCGMCDGTGKYFGGTCRSCGKQYETTARQITVELCESCEDKNVKAGLIKR